MMTRYLNRLIALAGISFGLLAASPAIAGWQSNFSFGAPLQADLYTPSTVATSPAILVAIHYCSGNKGNAHGWFDSLADKNGFYIIAPDAGKNCFDSSATRGGDRDAIVKMVQYLITNKSADKSRVFAAGFSSGGCMTNTLLAIYPDVFAGGAAMPGFPAGGWPAGDTSCTKCGASPPSTDGKYWGDIARKAFTWSGTYPCSQQWVGGADEYNFQAWLPAVVAQWQDIAGVDKGASGSGAPSGWTRMVYKDSSGNVRLETNVKSGQKHDLTGSGLAGSVVSFLGLDKPTGACGISSSGGGGASGSGGTTGGGGATGGKDGGAKDGGGIDVSGAGGAQGTGGKPGNGGATGNGTGGASGKGGANGSGGKEGTGGTPGTGGKSGSGGGSGGSSSGSGGSSSSASGGTTGSGGDTNDAAGGCSCRLGQGAGVGNLGVFVVAIVIGLGLVRRRRKTLG
jgi:poly(hydroxyalkanoate) depolymerase family esterase